MRAPEEDDRLLSAPGRVSLNAARAGRLGERRERRVSAVRGAGWMPVTVMISCSSSVSRLEQRLRQPIERRAMLAQQAHALVVALLQDALDLGVDHLGGRLAVRACEPPNPPNGLPEERIVARRERHRARVARSCPSG